MDLVAALADSPYPGRGLAVLHPARDGLCALYFLSGRSEPSRRRVLVGDGTGLLAAATTIGAGTDPLRHYRAATTIGSAAVVGNGSHVDEIATALARGAHPVEALRALTPEPDPPLFTARIVAVVDESTGTVVVGAARGLDGGSGCDHLACLAEAVPPGARLLVATYGGPTDAPRTWATPTWIDVEDTLTDQLAATWSALSPEIRVAVAARQIPAGRWTVVPAPGRAAGSRPRPPARDPSGSTST